MKTTEGYTETEHEGMVDRRHLMEYSEEEHQENEVNRANAKLVFSPEFIPFYPDIAKQFKLTNTEALLYGFIRFYVKNSKGRFYFTDNQLSLILDCSEQTIMRSIKKLKEVRLIKVGHKMRAGGGTIRFINGVSVIASLENVTLSELQNVTSTQLQSVTTNNNKIKENKIKENITKVIEETTQKDVFDMKQLEVEKLPKATPATNLIRGVVVKEYGNTDINRIIAYMVNKFDLPKLDDSVKNNRMYASLLVKAHGVEGVERLIDISYNDKWWRNTLTSLKTLHFNQVKIINSTRKANNGIAEYNGK